MSRPTRKILEQVAFWEKEDTLIPIDPVVFYFIFFLFSFPQIEALVGLLGASPPNCDTYMRLSQVYLDTFRSVCAVSALQRVWGLGP